MLKRFQILLTDWQEEYIRHASSKTDLSFSEVVRIKVSEGLITAVTLTCPEYKPGISRKELARMVKKGSDPETHDDIKHAIIAKIYFEARKAAEYKIKKDQKSKRKPSD